MKEGNLLGCSTIPRAEGIHTCPYYVPLKARWSGGFAEASKRGILPSHPTIDY